MALWKVKAYMEWEIEAEDEEEAVIKIGECIYSELSEGSDIRDIAEVGAEKIANGGFHESTD